MVIQVSKELDVVRIGIDRYSLKTGLNLKTVMDVSLRVLKEPRGFVRVIQCLMAILAFSTTASFSTDCSFILICKDKDPLEVEYDISYPFSINDDEFMVPKSCDDEEKAKLILPFDFSNVSEFFVATGVLSFLYTLIILVVYIFLHQTYANNPKIPVIDLGITAILAVFWLAGSSAWAQGVSDLKYYLHPESVYNLLTLCVSNGNECKTTEDGSYGTLNASLVLGFANFVLWAASLWFIYKETVFHTPDTAPTTTPTQNQTPTKDVGRV